MERAYNFSAGPSMMPVEILQQAKENLVSYPGAGCSVMEMSHRSVSFEKMIADAEESLRGQTTNYAVTGQFAGKALAEGERWGKAVAVTSSKADSFSHIPKITPELLSPDAAYLHITGNNTIFGTCYHTLPQTGSIPLVADWSSAILGCEIDVAAHALIYAGAQKNMGPAGLTVVIIRRDLLEREVDPIVPTMLRYRVMAENGSMYNTPPCFAIYMAGLMFQWVEDNGGVAAMMINLKGHRSVGGCRASIYNGMPKEGVEALVACMKDYEEGLRR